MRLLLPLALCVAALQLGTCDELDDLAKYLDQFYASIGKRDGNSALAKQTAVRDSEELHSLMAKRERLPGEDELVRHCNESRPQETLTDLCFDKMDTTVTNMVGTYEQQIESTITDELMLRIIIGFRFDDTIKLLAFLAKQSIQLRMPTLLLSHAFGVKHNIGRSEKFAKHFRMSNTGEETPYAALLHKIQTAYNEIPVESDEITIESTREGGAVPACQTGGYCPGRTYDDLTNFTTLLKDWQPEHAAKINKLMEQRGRPGAMSYKYRKTCMAMIEQKDMISASLMRPSEHFAMVGSKAAQTLKLFTWKTFGRQEPPLYMYLTPEMTMQVLVEFDKDTVQEWLEFLGNVLQKGLPLITKTDRKVTILRNYLSTVFFACKPLGYVNLECYKKALRQLTSPAASTKSPPRQRTKRTSPTLPKSTTLPESPKSQKSLANA